MAFGAALPANTLDDLDILHQMANRMDCAPLFTLSDWADVRLSEGPSGSFLFATNYQDDPIETTISSAGVVLLGGQPVLLPARRGVILPLEWHLKPGIVIHYVTAEIVAVSDEGARLTLRTDPAEFHAEVSLIGYQCDDTRIVQRLGERRLKLHGQSGRIELAKL